MRGSGAKRGVSIFGATQLLPAAEAKPRTATSVTFAERDATQARTFRAANLVSRSALRAGEEWHGVEYNEVSRAPLPACLLAWNQK